MNILLRLQSMITSVMNVSRVYTINGFDVSEGVGVINWGMVRESTEFNFCSFRACFGKETDDQWTNNVMGVRSIPDYPWYPYFVPKFGNWEAETDHFLSLWSAAGGSPMPPEIDVEYRYNPLDKSQTCSWLEKSAQKISAETGFERLLMYSNKSYWDSHVETRDYFRRNTDLEVAQWNGYIDEPDLIPRDWENLELAWLIWQWWNRAIRPFAPGTIDLKRFFGVHSDFVTRFGIQPYYAELPTPIPQVCEGLPVCMEVLQDGLKIRTAPDTGATIVGTLEQGEVLTVLDVGGSNSWIKHERGWSNVVYGTDVNMKKFTGQ